MAKDALLAELAAYPKPGMVSYIDSGSHSDMDAASFEASVAAITPYFADLSMAGFAGKPLAELRRIGVVAETSMFMATDGINTHKGAIFSLGLLAAAAGRAYRTGQNLGELGDIVAQQWGSQLIADEQFTAKTNGTVLYHRHGITGARGEAGRGFPAVFRVGLPSLTQALRCKPAGDAAVHCFFALLATVQDTTLIHRGGLAGLQFAREQAQLFNATGGVFNPDWLGLAEAIHREFMNRKLSAGGVADLLAAALFVHHLKDTITW